MPQTKPARDPDSARGSRIGDSPQPPRKPLVPRWVRLLLYPIFWLLLMLPALRRLRRDRRRWNLARSSVALAALAAGTAGIWFHAWWITAAAVALLLVSLALGPAVDPDGERELQRRHGADYLLNGGRLVSSWPGAAGRRLAPGTTLYLLLRGQQILLVPVGHEAEAMATIDIGSIADILVGGESYMPVYVSEAKDPPVCEKSVDRKAKTVMTLLIASGERVAFEYEGAFSKHLAESAAHAIYSVRKLGTTHGVAGQPPEIFHIVGR